MIRDLLTVLGGTTAIFACLFFLTAAVTGPITSDRFGPGCAEYQLCNDEADNGICEVSGSVADDVQVNAGMYTWTAYTTESHASATYSCDLYTSLTGSTANNTQKINSSPITESNQVYSWTGLMKYIWANCTITAQTVDLTVLACPISKN